MSLWGGERGEGVAAAGPPSAPLTRRALALPPLLCGAGDVGHLLVRGVAE